MSNEKRFEVEEVVAEEYQYVAQTAFQAQEDRARVTTFYLVSVGSLFGAFFGTTPTTEQTTLWAFTGLFLFLSYFGIITLRQLIQLRLAWFESARAMNQIKDFLITQNKELDKAFRWQTKTLPALYKPKSVAYYLAQQVAMLGAVTFSAMTFYAGLAITENLETNPLLIAGAVIGGLLFLKFQMKLYRKELEHKK
ncbi:MAG: hypothetical protein HN736_01765 [Anaerolineae bacterium]|jgi:hypothetical protein|nr:hypothetical protein [Anaerolineae bacterium]MBT3713673.1 hypothetical protein [Anaerolineae bacterium]MBT4310766.1 hypothetical protein [Anaerolineae bacterium]MBT4458236.1 hypothetical protein [Anaerolineae bacterium]MBT4841009.1 hypothetical protein [Anaerolineae bacterium]